MEKTVAWIDVYAQTDIFSQKLIVALEQLGILEKCKTLPIDHICARFAQKRTVDVLKASASEIGEIISAVEVHGREIIIIQLRNLLQLGNWEIGAIELPYPKVTHSYTDGWEHVEFVLSGGKNTMNGVREAFFGFFPELQIQNLIEHYSYSENEPHANGDQLPNPTIALKVHDVGIKFHAHSIQDVVGYNTDVKKPGNF